MGRTAMSARELTRVGVLARVKAGTLTVVSAAELLGVSYRQAKRLVGMFTANFARFEGHVDAAVMDAAPGVLLAAE